MTTKKRVGRKSTASTRSSTVATSASVSLLLRTISEQTQSDPTTGGIVLSHLKSGLFYGSIKSYRQHYGHGGVVEFKAQGETLDAVIRDLMKQYKAALVRKQQNATEQFLGTVL